MQRRIARGTNGARWKSMATRARYLRQISGIAIEGHRRTRKSRSSLSPSKISSRTSRSASGVNTGAHAFTHLRVRSHELRAICNACIHTLANPPRPPVGYTRAFTSPDMRARDCPKLVEILSSLAHADHMRLGTLGLGGEAANWTSAVSSARACRKILIFFIVMPFITSVKCGY